MVTYLIEYSVCLAIMLLTYRFILARTSLHQLKRFYLLGCLVLPLTLPLLEFNLYYGEAAVIQQPLAIQQSPEPFIELSSDSPGKARLNVQTERVLITAEAPSTIHWSFWVLSAYTLILAILLMRFLINIYRIGHLARASESELYKGHKVILLKGSATAYSFFHLIFIGEDDYRSTVTREHLLSHELAHARHWHSADILLLELLRILLWFNPLYLLLSKYIRLNHEYIADSQVLTQFGDSRVYQKLILNFATRTPGNTPLVSPSDFSFIKNRFSMMHKSTSFKVAAIRVVLLVAAVAGTFFSLAVELKPRPTVFVEPVQKTTPPVSSVTPTGLPLEAVKYSANMSDAPRLYIDDYYPGIDVTARPGSTVIATADGTVLASAEDDKKYGNYVLIGHSDEVQTLYASLGNVTVKTGQKVNLGDLLGTIGTSMPTTAISHVVDRVHYAISESGEWVNPYTYINLPAPGSVNEPGTAIPWAYPRALDVSKARDTRPDLSPVDDTNGEYMTFTGKVSHKVSSPSFIYDSSMGTEFINSPLTSVMATASGRVSEVINGHERYGTYVKIKHDELHETFYAKLDEVLVTPGQTVTKGETIGRIGKADEVFGRLHYKVLRNGISMTPGMYTTGARSGGALSIFGMKDKETKFDWNFPSGFMFKSILIKRKTVTFTKRSGAVITKTATELSADQKTALLSLTKQPYPREARRPVPAEVYERWQNPKVYQIRIDGDLIPSSEMTNYQPEDFAHCWWVVVSKTVKERKGHAFELSLYTPEYYETLNKEHKQRVNDWTTKTKKSLSVFNDF